MTKTIAEAAAAIRAGQFTPVDLVEQCLAQIERWESTAKAWVFIDREYAEAEAKRLADELTKGRYRGPLHGIPIGVKDIFDVFDWPTAAGSKRWTQSYARQDADVVRRLREAGAIFLGKTVTTQYASFDPPLTRNPWNLERTPGGSSSGSAVAVATGMCLGALGSQTGGSIIRPASYCGILGLKPSYGACSCEGVVPLAYSMDHPGPMGRSVGDLAILFRAMAIPGAAAPASSMDSFRFVRLGGLFDDMAEPAVARAMDAACDALRQRGTDIAQVFPPSGFADILERHRVVMAVEAAHYHHERFRRYPEEYELQISRLLDEGLTCPAAEYAEAKIHQKEMKKDVARLLPEGTIALTPATTSAAPPRATTGDPAFNSPWSYLGLPTISLPTGQFDDGLPIAIQLIAGDRQEENLFRAALWVESILAVGTLTPTRKQ